MKESILAWFTFRTEIQLDENLESEDEDAEKITFKVVHIKVLTMHITNQKLVLWYIYIEADLQKNFIEFS